MQYYLNFTRWRHLLLILQHQLWTWQHQFTYYYKVWAQEIDTKFIHPDCLWRQVLAMIHWPCPLAHLTKVKNNNILRTREKPDSTALKVNQEGSRGKACISFERKILLKILPSSLYKLPCKSTGRQYSEEICSSPSLTCRQNTHDWRTLNVLKGACRTPHAANVHVRCRCSAADQTSKNGLNQGW